MTAILPARAVAERLRRIRQARGLTEQTRRAEAAEWKLSEATAASHRLLDRAEDAERERDTATAYRAEADEQQARAENLAGELAAAGVALDAMQFRAEAAEKAARIDEARADEAERQRDTLLSHNAALDKALISERRRRLDAASVATRVRGQIAQFRRMGHAVFEDPSLVQGGAAEVLADAYRQVVRAFTLAVDPDASPDEDVWVIPRIPHIWRPVGPRVLPSGMIRRDAGISDPDHTRTYAAQLLAAADAATALTGPETTS